MSDCSRNAWAVPKAAQMPNFDGTDELVVDSMMEPGEVDAVRTVRVRQLPDAVFVRRATCTLTVVYRGYPCSDFLCSSCGKIHNAPHPDAFCPRCGAVVAEVIEVSGGCQNGAKAQDSGDGNKGRILGSHADISIIDEMHGVR